MEPSMSPQVLTFTMYTGFGGSVLATLGILALRPPVWGALVSYAVVVAVTAALGYLLRDIR